MRKSGDIIEERTGPAVVDRHEEMGALAYTTISYIPGPRTRHQQDCFDYDERRRERDRKQKEAYDTLSTNEKVVFNIIEGHITAEGQEWREIYKAAREIVEVFGNA